MQFALGSVGGHHNAELSVLYADRALCLLRLAAPSPEAALADCELALQANDGNVKVRDWQK